MKSKRKVPRADRRAQLIFVLMLVLVFGGLGAWFYSMKSSEPPRLSPDSIKFPDYNSTRITLVGYFVREPMLRIIEEASYFPALSLPQYQSYNWQMYLTSYATLKGANVIVFLDQSQLFPYQSKGIPLKGKNVVAVGTLYWTTYYGQHYAYMMVDSFSTS